MKLRCGILSVEDVGDKLRVKLQGFGVGEGEHRRWAPQLLEIPATAKARRAFYVGRLVDIELKPK